MVLSTYINRPISVLAVGWRARTGCIHKPSADLEKFNMKQQETRSPQVGEPRNQKPGQKKRFLIVKLEEWIAPSWCRRWGYKYRGKCCSA
jgi:hypothetical protein